MSEGGSVTTARWELSRGIELMLALRVGEQLRTAALSCAEEIYGPDAIPWVLSGHGIPRGAEHQHAFYLPEDADGDGRIDHVVVHAEAGLEPRALQALGLVTHIIMADVGEMWAGDGREARRGGTLLDEARWWVSMTPYLPPRHPKKRQQWHHQLRRECGWRGLPEPVRIEELPGASLPPPLGFLQAEEFERYRSDGVAAPYLPGWFLALEFDRPIAGPIAFGYGSHFGLGLFRPLTDLR